MSCGIWSIHPLTEKETIFCIYSSAFKICNSIYYLTVIVYNSPILSCLRFNDLNKGKGQLISKANCQAVNSSKKRTNEFVFTTMRHVFVWFLEEIEDTNKTFQNYLTFKHVFLFWIWLTCLLQKNKCKNRASQQTFDPSYFVMALGNDIIRQWQIQSERCFFIWGVVL